MTTRIITLLFALFCLTFAVSAEPEAEYKQLTKAWTLHPDGSQEFRCSMELTLFTHTAMNGTYGETFIVYDPQYQELKINASYTKQKDGTIIETPANAFVESLPHAAANAPAYNRLREMVVVHTGLELGATIYLDYTLTSKAGYLPELDIFEELLQSSPVKTYTLSITTPADKPVAYTLACNNTKPSVQEENGQRTTTWTLRNLPAESRAPYVSVANGDVPYFAATTFASEEAAFGSLFKQFNPAGDIQLQTIAENLTAGKENDAEKLKSILSYVRNDLADSPLSLEQTGYRLRKADEVIRTAYGTTAEKINLLTGLLNGAGYQAEPMASLRASIAQGAALKAIGQLYVKCMVGGDIYLFSVHSQMRPQMTSFNQMPLFSLATGKRVTLAIPEDYRIQGNFTFTGEKTNWQVAKQVTVGQTLLPYFSEYKPESNDSIALAVKDGYARLVLPDAVQGIAYQPYGYFNSKRSENLWISRPVDESYQYQIECADGMELCTPVKEETLRNEAGTLTYSIRQEGQTVHVTRSLKLDKQLYTPAEYKALRRLLVEWCDTNSKTLLFSIKDK